MYKVLLADDELWILAGLQAMIDWEGEGFTICATAENGILAEEKARQCNPDLILADIRMPGRDGLTLFRRLREARRCTPSSAAMPNFPMRRSASAWARAGICSSPSRRKNSSPCCARRAKRLTGAMKGRSWTNWRRKRA